MVDFASLGGPNQDVVPDNAMLLELLNKKREAEKGGFLGFGGGAGGGVGGAITGAKLGSPGGPIGAGVGGIIGGLLGLL